MDPLSTLTIPLANTVPIGQGDAFRTHHGEAISGNVLATDYEPGPAPQNPVLHVLTDDLVTSPHGTLTNVTADGDFTFEPDAGFAGTARFGYRLTDGVSESAEPTWVMIKVWNDVPRGTDDVYSVHHSQEVNPGVTANVRQNDPLHDGLDWDGDAVAADLWTSAGPVAAGASIETARGGSVHMDAAGTFTYSPDSDFTGYDAFTYRFSVRAAGAELCSSGPVQCGLFVPSEDSAPVAVDDAVEVSQGEVALLSIAQDLLGNDGGDWDAASFEIVAAPWHGEATWDAETLRYDLANQGAFYGQDAFTYRVSDSAGRQSTIATVRVEVVPDERYETVDDHVALPEDPGQPVALDVLANDVDRAGWAGSGGFSVTAGGDEPGQIDPQHGTAIVQNRIVEYGPEVNYSGSDSVTYTVACEGATRTGTVTVEVTPVNDAPTATSTN